MEPWLKRPTAVMALRDKQLLVPQQGGSRPHPSP
jgi:hypothetical protein